MTKQTHRRRKEAPARKLTSELAMQRKIFWLLFITLGLVLDFSVSIYWSLALTLPLLVLCWWVAYRSGWFE